MGKKLVLVGGGHAHMVTLTNLNTFIQNGHEVTVIQPSRHHYYSGMGPGMLGKVYAPEDIRFATSHVVKKQGGRFVLGKVVRVDPDKKIVFLESGDEIPYDVVSFNAGSHVPHLKNKNDNKIGVYSVKPIEKLLEAQKQIETLLNQRRIHIGIVGGGPSAAEVAGNVWRLGKDYGKYAPEISIYTKNAFMGRFNINIRRKVMRSLIVRKIKIYEKKGAKEIKSGLLKLENGESHGFDFIFLALGVKPSPIFTDSGLPTGPDEGLLVNKYLQSPRYPDMFGGGDCIYFQDQPLDKVGVYAVRENPVLYKNLMAQLEGRALQAFDPGGEYLLVFNLGDGTGVLHKKWLTLGGKLAFIIKDYIDRRFIKRFQSIE